MEGVWKSENLDIGIFIMFSGIYNILLKKSLGRIQKENMPDRINRHMCTWRIIALRNV